MSGPVVMFRAVAVPRSITMSGPVVTFRAVAVPRSAVSRVVVTFRAAARSRVAFIAGAVIALLIKGRRDDRQRAKQQADKYLRPQQVDPASCAGALQRLRHRADPGPGGCRMPCGQKASRERAGALGVAGQLNARVSLRFLPSTLGGCRISNDHGSLQRCPELASCLMLCPAQNPPLYLASQFIVETGRECLDQLGPGQVNATGAKSSHCRGQPPGHADGQIHPVLRAALSQCQRERHLAGSEFRFELLNAVLA
jgi:hypothetical protein